MGGYRARRPIRSQRAGTAEKVPRVQRILCPRRREAEDLVKPFTVGDLVLQGALQGGCVDHGMSSGGLYLDWVERAVSGQRSKSIDPDTRWSLEHSLEDEVTRWNLAVSRTR